MSSSRKNCNLRISAIAQGEETLDIAEEHRGDITIVEIKGRIDSNTAKPFGERLTGLIKAGRMRVVVDLKHLVYISSAGFRALLVAGQLAEESKGTLALCGLSSEVQRLFDLGAFTDLFVIYGSREEGLTKLS
jgi:anti-sigma B factor antagonist